MAATGQTLNDRLNAARYAIAGQGLARTVCKATTEEMIAPKKKHLDYLIQCTHEANVSIPQLADLLIERTSHGSWIVVFKSLITVHHLMCYGNERFTQYLASSNCSFQLSNFLDKTNPKGYDMSTYIRRYAHYVNEKALSYRTVAVDFAKMKRGKDDGYLRTMPTDKLLKTVPTLQNQVDALLGFDCTAMDLSNGVIGSAFMLLFRDLIRLFASYNDGMINLLEHYFGLSRKQCREALDLYKKFLIRMDKVSEFMKVAENIGIDKGDIPDLCKAPNSLLEALEGHLQSMEARGKRHKEKGQNKENSESTSTTKASTSGTTSGSAAPEEDLVKKALEEEAAVMNQLKEKYAKDKPFNPFLSDAPAPTSTASTATTSGNKDDILELFAGNPQQTGLNPFGEMIAGQPSVNSSAPTNVSASSASSQNRFEPNFGAAFGASAVNGSPSAKKVPPSRPPPPSKPKSAPQPESSNVQESVVNNPFLIEQPEVVATNDTSNAPSTDSIETNPFANPFLSESSEPELSQQMADCSLDSNNNPNCDSDANSSSIQ